MLLTGVVHRQPRFLILRLRFVQDLVARAAMALEVPVMTYAAVTPLHSYAATPLRSRRWPEQGRTPGFVRVIHLQKKIRIMNRMRVRASSVVSLPEIGH